MDDSSDDSCLSDPEPDDGSVSLCGNNNSTALVPPTSANNSCPYVEYETENVNEEKMLENAIEHLNPGKLKSVLRTLSIIFDSTHAFYQDILPMVLDGRRFIIDGDSLLMIALSSSTYDESCGGQTLHIVYIIEKFLNTLVIKGLKFFITFSKAYESVWLNLSPSMALARESVKLHLTLKSSFEICELDPSWDEGFVKFVNQFRPSFYMTFVGVPNLRAMERKSADLCGLYFEQLKFLIFSQLVCCSFLNLDVVDIDSTCPAVSTMFARVHISSQVFPFCEKILRTIRSTYKAFDSKEEICDESSPSTPFSTDFRMTATVKAAIAFLKKKKTSASGDNLSMTVQLIILHTVMLSHLPLASRCFKNRPDPMEPTISLLHEFQHELVLVIKKMLKEGTGDLQSSWNFDAIADIWHGNLFKILYYTVLQLGGLHKQALGGEIAEQYDQMSCILNSFLETKTDCYFSVKKSGDIKSGVDKKKSSKSLRLTDALIPSSCKLTKLFCKDIITDVGSQSGSNDPTTENFLKMVGRWKTRFQEVTHWHVKKPLTDEYDRVPEQKLFQSKNPRHSQTQKNNLARFYTYYGQSLEGKTQAGVICSRGLEVKSLNQSKNHGKKGKTSKPSGKKEKIIEENLKRKASKNMQFAEEKLKSFLPVFKNLDAKGLYLEASKRCDSEILSCQDCDSFVFQVLMKKVEACFKYWCYFECAGFPTHKTKRNMFYVKELFVTVQKVLIMSENCSSLLIEKDKQLLSRVLYALGFCELASIWNLPNNEEAMENRYAVQMSHIEFQLMYLSAELDRDSGNEPDPRVQGFNPDPWQRQLFDIIDNNQSAVVVAPTSSGKTYASYYCMEKVIKESDDGLVVYVSPTKALVNQVYATIYARFKKSMPPGKSLQGVFTRDYRSCDSNCQILVTVPECLELLLLSPRKHAWSKRLKYVIFDEVHCLAGQSGGIAWENSLLLIRCPFLALSATINEPEAFTLWLQKAETFKQAQGCGNRSPESYKVHLVVHTERHNHLRKSVLHMDGSMEKLHPYALLDETLLEECGGVPKHITMSPDEALLLYHAMKDHLPAHLVDGISPDHFFKSLCIKGFLSMPLVKQYSEELRKVLDNLPINNISAILKSFQFSSTDAKCGLRDVHANISLLLEYLKANKMLPALVFSYNRRIVNALPQKLLAYLKEQDDSESEEEVEVKEEESNPGKKNAKQERKTIKFSNKFQRELRLTAGSSMLKSNGSIRGEGYIDEKLVEFMEMRLKKQGFTSSDDFPQMLRRGLGKHYGGMNNVERSSVEMLFRMKVLNMVFATGTLAQGIHMPCKTVVIAGDNQFLNALEYHQMSGRAGRRGYDNEGNVIFFGVNHRKIKTLLTANVPKMVGNFPICMSLVLRLLLLVSDVTDEGAVCEESTKAAISSCFVLLEKSLLFETCPNVKEQIKHFFLFAHQFFIYQGLLDDGKPLALSGLATHLHYHEPSNFAFIYLLEKQVLENLCVADANGGITYDSLLNLMIVLNFLFAPLPFKKQLSSVKWNNSKVILPILPSSVEKALLNYNQEVLDIFSHYYECVSDRIQKVQGKDVSLPVSKLEFPPPGSTSFAITSCSLFCEMSKMCRANNVCSAFAGLSGNTDSDLFPPEGRINNVRHDIDTHLKIVPTIILDERYNSYALDFFKHGISHAICTDNGLKSGEDFRLLKDFCLVLCAISVSLEELLSPTNKLVLAINKIKDIFQRNFNKCYYGNRAL